MDQPLQMTSDSKSELRDFVGAWKVASERLEALRREDLRDVNVARHIMALNGAFDAALAGPTRKSSGLVEQQAIFSRLRNARPVSPGG